MAIVGVDIGGSGIKGAPVDLAGGALAEARYRLATPQPSEVAQVVRAVGDVVRRFDPAERVGITFPGVVVSGVTKTAANMDKSWLDAPAAALFAAELGRPVTVLNDADAAGIAEVRFGVAPASSGVTVLLTFGTGIGSALFLDGRLVPNTEFGHLQLHGEDAELWASDRARQDDDLGWHAWAERLEKYLNHLEMLLRPDLFIIGGGVSKKADHYLPLIHLSTPVVAAVLQNNAGIIGAAIAAAGA